MNEEIIEQLQVIGERLDKIIELIVKENTLMGMCELASLRTCIKFWRIEELKKGCGND